LADGSSAFPVEGNGRYVLYVAAGCPFAARPWLVAEMTGLTDKEVPLVKAFPGNSVDGWFFVPGNEEEERNVKGMRGQVAWHEKEPIKGYKRVREIYDESCKTLNVKYTGAVTLPVLFDTKRGVIVSNDSMDISWCLAVEMASLHGSAWKSKGWDLFPEEWDEKHSELIHQIHDKVNRAVYVCHFEPQQDAYERLLSAFWDQIKGLDVSLSSKKFLMQGTKGTGGSTLGVQPVFADLMLYATCIRFDVAYAHRFRVGTNLMRDFDNIWAFTCRMYSLPGVKEASDIRGIMATYYLSFPLRTKAALTVPPVPCAFEKALMGGVSKKTSLLSGGVLGGSFAMLFAMVVAAFAMGVAAAPFLMSR